MYHAASLSMRWVQLRHRELSVPNTPAERYRLLAEFAFREHALAERAWSHIGRPEDHLAARIHAAHPDDSDVTSRARQFHRRLKLYWSRLGMPYQDDETLPPA